MRNNKGLSLVELIVVIAILAIISVAAFSGFSILTTWNVNKCASTIDDELNKNKITAMSKDNVSFRLYKEGDSYYIESTNEQKQLVGKSPVTISYYATNDISASIPIDATGLTLKYNRSSGAFESIAIDNDGKLVYCNKIYIENTNSGKSRTIQLVYATGKHSIQ